VALSVLYAIATTSVRDSHLVIRDNGKLNGTSGHTVVIAMGEPSVKSACHQHRFDVVVIGQTTSANTKRQIMALIRKHYRLAKVLELYRFTTGQTLEDADSWLEVPADVPRELAARVTALAANACGFVTSSFNCTS